MRNFSVSGVTSKQQW